MNSPAITTPAARLNATGVAQRYGPPRALGRVTFAGDSGQVTGQTVGPVSVGLPPLRPRVGALSGGRGQAGGRGGAVLWGSEVVILAEPAAAIAVQQTAQVLRLIRTLSDRGLAVVVISHSLPDVFAVADKIWVLRLGANAGIFDRATASSQEGGSAITCGATLPEGDAP